MFNKLISGIFRSSPQTTSQLSSTATTLWNPWSLTFVRNKMRYYFPHPNERKRIRKHGWLARLSTLNGRRIIQRRILKGKHVLSH